MGRKVEKGLYKLDNQDNQINKEVEFFPWEKLDYIDKIKKSFKL